MEKISDIEFLRMFANWLEIEEIKAHGYNFNDRNPDICARRLKMIARRLEEISEWTHRAHKFIKEAKDRHAERRCLIDYWDGCTAEHDLDIDLDV